MVYWWRARWSARTDGRLYGTAFTRGFFPNLILSSRPQEGVDMLNQTRSILALKIFVVTLFLAVWGWSQQAQDKRPPQGAPTRDAVVDAQTTQSVPITRPGQRKTEHDLSDIFKAPSAESSSPALVNQPDQGKMLGFRSE